MPGKALYKIMKDEKSLTTLSEMIYLKKAQLKNPQSKADKKSFLEVFLSSSLNEEYLNHNPLCVILVIISP